MIPEGLHCRPAYDMAEDFRHGHGQRRRAARAADDRMFAHIPRCLGDGIGRYGKTHGGDGGGRAGGVSADQSRRAVHGKIDARVQDRRPDQRHDRHERLHQHRAIADHGRVAFAGDQLGGGPAGNQRMKSRHRAAGDGDEQEGKQATGPDRPVAGDESRQRRHLERRRHDDDADGERGDCPDLEKGRQIVARREQQPDRQHGRHRTIADQDPAKLYRREGEGRPPGRRLRYRLSVHDRGDQADEAQHRHLADPARPDPACIGAHCHGERHGGRNGEHAPGAFGQRLDHDQRQHRQDDDHDHERAEQGDRAGNLTHLHADEFAQRLAVAAHGNEQDHEILHRAGQHHAEDDPQRAGQIAHLGGEHGSDQWPRARDRGEMMAEQDGAVGRDIVQAIGAPHGGGGPCRIYPHDMPGDEQRIIAIGDQKAADCRDDDPQRVDAFPP